MGCANSKAKAEPTLVKDATEPIREPTPNKEEPAPVKEQDLQITLAQPAEESPMAAGSPTKADSSLQTNSPVRAAFDSNATLADFEIGRLLGRGAFGKVRLAVHKLSGDKFAMKTLNKHMLVQAKQVGGVMTEKSVLKERGHPCIVRLYHAFQDATSLHMLLDYCPGGDLYERIESEGSVSVERARLYAAEITLGVGHLHDVLEVIYRDIKPENILLDVAGHAKLTDFGLAVRSSGRKAFCGSTEYIAPEVVKLRTQRDGEHDKAVDWWGLGVVLHELLLGSTPFDDDNHEVVLRKIVEAPIELSDTLDPEAAALITLLLDRDPKSRLGSGASGTKDVMAHAFWQPLTFDGVLGMTYVPAWTPPDPDKPKSPSIRSPSRPKPIAEEAEEAEEEDGDDGDDLDAETETDCDDEEDDSDEWHQAVPGGGASSGEMDELFRGFTFHRKQSFMPKPKDGQLTRAMSLKKRQSSMRK